MKTLITIANSDLRRMFFRPEVIAELEAFSQIDWVEEDQPFKSHQLAEIIGGYDACITSWGSPKLDADVLKWAERLKFIGHAAGTVIPIVNDDVFDTSITVTNANKVLAQSTAESAVALMMAGAWRVCQYAEGVRGGVWSVNAKETVLGLTGRTIGLLGFGEISRQVIKLLAGFHPRILVYSRYCKESEAAELGVELVQLDELLAQSDIVSLHNTWTPETEGMIGARELGLIRDGALLVNTARGAIINEEALINELRSGRISAALDVYNQEPLPVSHPLLALPNAICLPHIGGYHGGFKENMGRFVIRDLKRFLEGDVPEGRISREMYKRLTPR
ncbi:MAG: hydroxyacid dehydrogenase [Paenibacillaceae bacterium]|jgi:phosphoglycerate dehydrogenase-like enzyme|nr:hydroxyacid dehydrogenase [Paenibacillaceae bacterium]